MTPRAAPPSQRLPAIDLLRGAAMVLMALDHVRDFFSNALPYDGTDFQHGVGLFYTRWMTHFCAPVFVFLAGVGAALAEDRGLTKSQLARFLLTRGLWLVFLELTLVRLGFFFTFDFHEIVVMVIWALGWSMVLLAGQCFLPRWLLVPICLALIAGHNALDDIDPDRFGRWKWLWVVLHDTHPEHQLIQLGRGFVLVAPYKIIPWFAVMGLGYCMGPIFRLEPSIRRRILLSLGILTTLAFVAVRAAKSYGDPSPWNDQLRGENALPSFLNCTKYPPSLCFLLMTLGPAMVGLAAFDRPPGWLARRIIVLGRVPLFFYLLHLPLIHGLAVLASLWQYGEVLPWLVAVPSQSQAAVPSGYGYSLPVVYAVWLLVVLMLYPLCAWYAELKRRHPDGWLSYL